MQTLKTFSFFVTAFVPVCVLGYRVAYDYKGYYVTKIIKFLWSHKPRVLLYLLICYAWAGNILFLSEVSISTKLSQIFLFLGVVVVVFLVGAWLKHQDNLDKEYLYGEGTGY